MAIRIVLRGLSAISPYFMKRNNTFFCLGQNLAWLLAAAFSTSMGVAHGSEWPQFMGSNGDGTSPEKGLLRAWPAAGPKVLWTVPLGAGYGGAAVRSGKVFVLDRQEQKQDILRCLDLATGKELWNLGYEAPGRIDHDGSRSTPAVTDERVYAIGPFGNLRCVDIATHKLVWQKNIVTDFGASAPRWAVAQSPLLHKDMVISAPQGGEVGLVAFDQATGQEKWRSEAIGAMAYGSPMVLQVGGIDQVVIVNGKGRSPGWQAALAIRPPLQNRDPEHNRPGAGEVFHHGGVYGGERDIPGNPAGRQVGGPGSGAHRQDRRALPPGIGLPGSHLCFMQRERTIRWHGLF